MDITFHQRLVPARLRALVRLRLLRLNGTWQRDWSERFAAVLRPWPPPA